MYLVETDYKKAIKGEILAIILGGDTSIRLDAELAAEQEMESYLSSRFDLPLVFLQYDDFNASNTYMTGTRVKNANVVYEAKQDNITGAFNSALWDKKFERSALITMYLVDLALYHVHSRIMPQQIPALRENRYNAAIDYLEKAAKGTINPQLPRVLDSEGVEEEKSLTWGSGKKFSTKNNRYF